ncbi:PAS domain-containing protein [Pontibacterium granulatum]|uniref:PAS domain-containing protein n=1 Tax=Pontibacterium granulatum TaxID=2036029 RepID=UPI00249C4849|nr:PAS domain-containing protein [Pontibacterium granulatum]MDI3325517.1 PAS domain-containing protein [Pontibacterium granulatum]
MSDQDTGECREVTINYFDGTSRVATIVDREVPYPDGKLIVSRTDSKGIITHANQAFVDMSGYTRDELIGVNHYILRHPDMPAVAFAGLWETIEAGKKWHGYVKNLRKDGSYYWVKATVIPNIRNGKLVGYTSVRRKPSRSKIKESEELYATLM